MRANLHFTQAVLSPLLALVISMSSAHSAPASSDELAGSAEAKSTGPEALQGSPGAGLPVVTSVPQSKTVELLLQLQDQPNGLSGAARPTSDPSKRRLTSTAASAPDQLLPAEDTNPLRSALKATVLGDGMTRNVQNDSDASAPHRDGAPERTGSTSSGYGTQSRREPSEGLLSNPVIRYIRENRGMVVGVSLAVLAAIWLTANFSLRRSR